MSVPWRFSALAGETTTDLSAAGRLGWWLLLDEFGGFGAALICEDAS